MPDIAMHQARFRSCGQMAREQREKSAAILSKTLRALKARLDRR
jgi:hypothetical protein